MPRRATIFAKGAYYHIYNRGVAKQNIFLIDADRLRFISRIGQYSNKFDIVVIAYCLMPNHFHLIVRQEGEDSVGIFLRHLLVSYAMYFNKKYQRVGPVFQSRFKSKLIPDDTYMLQLVRYIHQNPREVMDRNVELQNYEWSSYPTYLGFKIGDFVDTEFV